MTRETLALVLNPSSTDEGFRDSVKLLYTKRLDLKPCTGELAGWSSIRGDAAIQVRHGNPCSMR